MRRWLHAPDPSAGHSRNVENNTVLTWTNITSNKNYETNKQKKSYVLGYKWGLVK